MVAALGSCVPAGASIVFDESVNVKNLCDENFSNDCSGASAPVLRHEPSGTSVVLNARRASNSSMLLREASHDPPKIALSPRAPRRPQKDETASVL